MGRGQERTGLDEVMCCRCWDCVAFRRHLLRKAALVAVLLGLSGGWAFDKGAWSGALASQVDPSSEVVALAWL